MHTHTTTIRSQGRRIIMRCSPSSHLFQRTVLICLYVVIGQTSRVDADGTADHPTNRIDVMGQYRVDNADKCARLCWYRLLCSSYSFCSDCHLSVNCLLHSVHVEGGHTTQPAHPDWAEQNASDPNPSSGCAARPGGPNETCAPAMHGGQHCLYSPAECDVIPIPNGLLEKADAVFQGDVNRVICPQYFVISPRNASMDIKCQVNARWTTAQGQCLQTEFVPPVSGSVFGPLPWALEAGWAMCFKGVYLDPKAVRLRFRLPTRDCPVDTCDYPFRLVLRLWVSNPGNKGTLWSQRINGIERHTYLTKGHFPLQLGQAFAVSIMLSTNALSVRLHSHANYSIPMEEIVLEGVTWSMSDVDSINISGNVSITYVNLLEECTEE